VATPLCLLYAAGVFAFLALRHLLLEWPPLLLVFAFLGPWLYAPLLLLLPLAFFSRARPAIAASLAVLLLFLGIYLPFFLPRFGAAPATAGGSLVAMAFNLGPGVSQPAELVAAIGGTGAGIVALEEVYPEAAAAFEEELAQRYPYRLLPSGGGASGLLSRYPIREHEYLRLAGVGRPALRVVLDVAGETLHVFVLHPDPPINAAYGSRGRLPVRLFDEHQEAQMADLARRARALAGPVLALGDFNMSDQSRPYVVISRALGDAFREAGFGFGFTFPVNLARRGLALPGPLWRIDYVFHNDAFYARRAYVGCQGGSDHCYVVAELERVAQGAQP